MSDEKIPAENRDQLSERFQAALDQRIERIVQGVIAPLQSQVASLQDEIVQLRALVEKSHQ